MTQSGIYYPDDKPMIQNIVSTCILRCHLDLPKIAISCRNTEYNSKRFAAAVMKLKNPKTTALVFSSGKIVCTGAKTEFFSKLAAKKFAKTIKKIGFQVRFTDFEIQNIVGSCDLGFPIKLTKLQMENLRYTHYEPEIFPGLIFRVFQPKVVILVFSSGKVVLTGAKSLPDIFEAYRKIVPLLKGCINHDEDDIGLNKYRGNSERVAQRNIANKQASKAIDKIIKDSIADC